jgi:hypothetical protein
VPRPLRFDRDLVPDVVDVAVQEVSHLLNGRAESEAVSEFGHINRGPKPFVLSAHGPPHRSPNGIRLRALRGIFAAHKGSRARQNMLPAVPGRALTFQDPQFALRPHPVLFCGALIAGAQGREEAALARITSSGLAGAQSAERRRGTSEGCRSALANGPAWRRPSNSAGQNTRAEATEMA